MQDLEGLTVISVEHAVAAPYASVKLADAGARVIKVERPEGDFARGYDSLAKGKSAYFVWLNRGKESIALDLKDESDKAVLRAMLASADIFIQNLGPGVIDRLGFGADALLAERPDLIMCSISGYGSSGPRSKQKAYDLLIQAESGLASITGGPEAPARVGVSVVDIAAGMTAYQTILEALIGRGITGKGRHIEVSMFQAMADWLNVPYLQYRYGGKAPARQGLRHPSIAPYGVFQCADDSELLISIQNDREWRKLCTELGCPEEIEAPATATNEARVANREATDALVQRHLGGLTRGEAIALLDRAGIAYGRVSTMEDLAELPPAHFSGIAAGEEQIELLAPGVNIAGQAPVALGSVPELDENGAALRAEFG